MQLLSSSGRRLCSLLLLAGASSSLLASASPLRSSSPSETRAVPVHVREAPLPASTAASARDAELPLQCFKSPLEWTSENGELLVNGQPFHLKGTSWFGFETVNEFPHGLWSVSADSIMGFLRNNSFNALRLPISAKLALQPDKLIKPQVVDEAFHNMTAMELIGAIVDKAAEHDIVVMLDMHRLNEDLIPELWYDADYSLESLLQAWDNVLTAMADKWNIFALDIKNEPHGMATWGAGEDLTDWNKAAETISKHIYDNHPDFKGLVFIEGVQLPNVTSRAITKENKWWGGDLEGVWDNPIDLGSEELNKRVVYSPHVYGPSVFLQDFFTTKDFPGNLPRIWHNQWGFVEGETSRAVVIGEWGGHYDEVKDVTWQNSLAAYLVDQCLEDTFYWCLNPNSGDTGGLLDYDFVTPKKEKLGLLARVQPHPSWLSQQADGAICFTPGEYANPACKGGIKGGRRRAAAIAQDTKPHKKRLRA